MISPNISSQINDAPAHFVVLAIGQVRIALPERDIRTLELVNALQPVAHGSSVGAIALEGSDWPIFGLSEELDPLSELPEGCRVCVLMEVEGRRFGLACDDVRDVRSDQVRLAALPACMASAESPVKQLAISGDNVFCVTTVRLLADHLERRGCSLVFPVPNERVSTDFRDQRIAHE